MGQKRIDTKSFGFTEPAKGIGTLQFNAEVTQIQTYYVQGKRREAILGGNSLNYAFKLRLKSDPWHKTGLQPFTWDYLAPLGERLYPIIRIVASRQVEIVSELDAPLIEIKGKVLFNDLISGIKGILQPSEKFLDMPANYGR